MEYITDTDYVHAKWVFTDIGKNLGDYHNQYVLSDTLLLVIF